MICKGDGVYNLVVIGAATAGLVTAAGTAGLGGRVAIRYSAHRDWTLAKRRRAGSRTESQLAVPSVPSRK